MVCLTSEPRGGSRPYPSAWPSSCTTSAGSLYYVETLAASWSGRLTTSRLCLAFHPQTAAELNNGQVNKHNEKQTQVTNIQKAEGSGGTSLTVPLETARGHTKGKQRQGSG